MTIAIALAALVVGVILGVIGDRLLSRRRPHSPKTAGTDDREREQPAAIPDRPPAAAGTNGVDQLADAAIDVLSRSTNAAHARLLREGLEAAGWRDIDPTGEPFDPEVHVAVDYRVTTDPALSMTIASTDRTGFVAPSGAIARMPEVVVYRVEPTSADQS